MAQQTLTLTVSVAWWLSPYLHALAFLCQAMGTEPDAEKLAHVCARALTVRAR